MYNLNCLLSTIYFHLSTVNSLLENVCLLSLVYFWVVVFNLARVQFFPQRTVQLINLLTPVRGVLRFRAYSCAECSAVISLTHKKLYTCAHCIKGQSHWPWGIMCSTQVHRSRFGRQEALQKILWLLLLPVKVLSKGSKGPHMCILKTGDSSSRKCWSHNLLKI